MKLCGKIILLFNNSAAGKYRFRPLYTLGGFLFFLSVVIFVIALSFIIDRLLKFPPVVNETLSLIISIPLMIAGTVAALWCVFFFLKEKGTPVPLNPPPKLLTTGPYAFSRNPMSTGLITFIFGLGIYSQSITLSFCFVPIIVLLNYFELKCIEEPELEKRFGEQYIEYKKHVPMFFPRFFKNQV